MLLLGVLAAQAEAAPVAASDYDLLASEVLSGSQASVSFDVSGYASTYQHLQIRMTVRTTTSGAASDIRVRLNSDTGSNYAYHQMLADGAGVRAPTPGTSANHMRGGQCAGASAATNAFSGQILDLLDPFETSKYSIIKSMGGIGNSYVHFVTGMWFNTASVTDIELADNYGGSLVSGCRFSIYGLRSVTT